ncbi:hypothetical protein [Bradyrhizobium sp. 138]|uniref:hypothetical protein n=1 Tax=Bradyrhizobium sp. 138 TaxID=2782615 RepID=UPI001FF9080B|nr:hypothetical protein [Bradyrhizobium sp. 138]
MTNSIILIPGMLKPLRLARVYGFLVERRDGVYHPGGSQPACSLVWRRRWLKVAGW